MRPHAATSLSSPLVLAAFTLLATAAPASAQFSSMDSTREVYALYAWNSPSGSGSTPANPSSQFTSLGPWSGDIGNERARATQTSTVTPSLISAGGTVMANVPPPSTSMTDHAYTTRASFRADFRVVHPTFVVFDTAGPTMVTGNISNWSSTLWYMPDIGSPVAIASLQTMMPPSLTWSGTLQPGAYRTTLELSSSGLLPTGSPAGYDFSYDYSMSLTVPAPAGAAAMGVGVAVVRRRRR